MSSVPMKYGLHLFVFDFKDKREQAGKKETSQ